MKSFTVSESLIKEMAIAEIPNNCTKWELVGEYTCNPPRGDHVLLGYALVDFARNEAVSFAWERSDLDVYAEMQTDSHGEENVDLRVAKIALTRGLFEETLAA